MCLETADISPSDLVLFVLQKERNKVKLVPWSPDIIPRNNNDDKDDDDDTNIQWALILGKTMF